MLTMKKMMIFLLSLSIAAAQKVQPCFPTSCQVDSDCVDPIHSLYLAPAKCCAGKCVETQSLRDRLIGQTCNAPGSNSLCVGNCAAGSFCSTDGVCHALHGSGCACSATSECLRGNCAFFEANTTLKLCQMLHSVRIGGFCTSSSQCQSRFCNGTSCEYLKPGDDCSGSTGLGCGPNATCRYNNPTNTFRCFTLCATNAANCCEFSADCKDQGACLNGTCLAPLAPAVSGLGEQCASAVNCKNDSWICDANCNATSCSTKDKVCQLPNQIAQGQSCYSTVQCASNSTCVFMGNESSTCVVLGAVPVGQPCSFDRSCAPPGQICGPSASGAMVCKLNSSTPVGDLCIRKPAPLSDCVPSAQCLTNGSNSTCVSFLAVGDSCFSKNPRTCVGGNANCAPPVLGGLCVLSTSNCVCVAPKTVADGGACKSSVQCSGANSICAKPNGTCTPVVGMSCNSPADCGEGFPKFDCNCARKCYLTNNSGSTPSVPPPAPPTPAGLCSKQQAAWLAVQPPGFEWAYSLPGYVDEDSFQGSIFKCGPHSFISSLTNLNASVQARAIAFACCVTCPFDLPFNSFLDQGHQVDCKANTVMQLDDTCNDLRGSLAFTNCWKSVPPVFSAATSILVGPLVLFALVMFN